MDNTIKEIGDQLSRIFRHMLPGLAVIGAAYISHPEWFRGVDATEGWHVALLAAAAFALGNIWYVLHRYTVHQSIDFSLFFMRRICCGKHKKVGYLNWLADYVYRSFEFQGRIPSLRDHLHFRSAQVILMFIVSEIILLFAFWNDKGSSFFAQNEAVLKWLGGGIFAFAVVQYVIGEKLDRTATERQCPHEQPAASEGSVTAPSKRESGK